jgi:hypothetical protein
MEYKKVQSLLKPIAGWYKLFKLGLADLGKLIKILMVSFEVKLLSVYEVYDDV